MSTPTLAALQAAFKKPENTGGGMPNNYYPFWNMEIGESCTVRFLPDGKADNPLGFLVEKVMHNLDINGERKTVPCLSMYGEDCPVCAVSQAYYKANDDKNGSKYWKKKQHIAQVMVVEDPLAADEATGENHEGQVRFITLGWQVFEVIKEAFESGELDEVPFAYEGGCNFIIKKTQGAKYASYSVGTKFARKSSDLDEDVIATFELSDLSGLLPKNPGREKVEAMLEAALTGGDYEESGSGSTETEDDDEVTSTPKAEKKAAPAKVEEVVESDDSDIDDEADDILAQIRSRKQKKAE